MTIAIGEDCFLKELLSPLIKREVQSLVLLPGGRNNRVYKLLADDGATYLVKEYFWDKHDLRDRLSTEFNALKLLWGHEIRCIPRPLAMNADHHIGIYEYLEGISPFMGGISESDVDQVVALLGKLRMLALHPSSSALPLASEAFLSIASMRDNYERRLDRLCSVPPEGASSRAMISFVKHDLIPAQKELIRLSFSRLNRLFEGPELPQCERTLSPSDLGFHNALRRSDGEIWFIDFEYFGWDDPAKTICDFVLHPEMKLEEPLKQSFVNKTIRCFGNTGRLLMRIHAIYPLAGLHWCLILLNEFLPSVMRRRAFATPKGIAPDRTKFKQLHKAKDMLEQILKTNARFPYAA